MFPECGTCKWFVPIPDHIRIQKQQVSAEQMAKLIAQAKGVGKCYLNPPSTETMLQQHPITGEVIPQGKSNWPEVRDSSYCSHHQKKIEV